MRPFLLACGAARPSPQKKIRLFLRGGGGCTLQKPRRVFRPSNFRLPKNLLCFGSTQAMPS